MEIANAHSLVECLLYYYLPGTLGESDLGQAYYTVLYLCETGIVGQTRVSMYKYLIHAISGPHGT